jgi:hypothetical protein
MFFRWDLAELHFIAQNQMVESRAHRRDMAAFWQQTGHLLGAL